METITRKPRIAGGDGDDFEYVDRGIEQARKYANSGGLILRTVSIHQGREVMTGPGLALSPNGVHVAGFAALSRQMPEIHHSPN